MSQLFSGKDNLYMAFLFGPMPVLALFILDRTI